MVIVALLLESYLEAFLRVSLPNGSSQKGKGKIAGSETKKVENDSHGPLFGIIPHLEPLVELRQLHGKMILRRWNPAPFLVVVKTTAKGVPVSEEIIS